MECPVSGYPPEGGAGNAASGAFREVLHVQVREVYMSKEGTPGVAREITSV
jgi:hypothetical protein